MRKLTVFNNVSLDGYIADRAGDMSWAHRQDPEWIEFVGKNASGPGTLVFGRITYQMMAAFWPTPQAAASFPDVARQMNSLPKVVFSKTLDEAAWNNTRLLKGDLPGEVQTLKENSPTDLVILGSASIVSQLAHVGLIDTYQVAVHPVVLGGGKSMFEGLNHKIGLKLTSSRTFGNGSVFLCYEKQPQI